MSADGRQYVGTVGPMQPAGHERDNCTIRTAYQAYHYDLEGMGMDAVTSREFGLNDEHWVGIGAAAREASVDPSTMRRWADAGKVRARVTPGGTRQISMTSLQSGYRRETAARRSPGPRKRRETVGPVPDAEHAPPETAIPYLAASAESWSRWTPHRLPSARIEALLRDVVTLRDALADIEGVLVDELRDRNDDTFG